MLTQCVSVDTDIRKPDTGAAHFQRPSGSNLSTSASNTPHNRTPDPYIEPLSEGEEDEEVAIAIPRDENRIAGLDPAAATEAISYRESFLRERTREDEERKKQQQRTVAAHDDLSDEDERTSFLKRRRSSVVPSVIGRPRNLSINPLTPSSLFDKSFKSRFSSERLRLDADNRDERDEPDENLLPSNQDTPGRGGNVQYLREWRAQDGKRIAVPVRIEPKVYFATERTFLVGFPQSIFRTSSCSSLSRGGCSSPW